MVLPGDDLQRQLPGGGALLWRVRWEKKMKASIVLAIIIMMAVSLGHLLRVIFQLEVTVGEMLIPQWMSVAGFILTGAMAIYLWIENRKRA